MISLFCCCSFIMATAAEPPSQSVVSDVVTPSQRVVNDVIDFDSLTFLDEEPIGSGGFGVVYSVLHNEWGCQVAYKRLSVFYIKEIKKDDEGLIQKLKYEAEIHSKLRHPNIVSMLGVVFEPNNYGIILEYVTYGSWTSFLSHVAKASEFSVPTILKIKLVHEISSGMSYLHSLEFIHCDLKAQNVLIGEQLNAKISDFGLSKWKNYSRSHSTINTKGTPTHIAPEQWKDDSFRPNDKSDVYSFSILLWEMFTEKEAYEGRHHGMIGDLVMSGKRLPLKNNLPRDLPSEICDLIKACWNTNPEKRPCFSDLTKAFHTLVDGPVKRELINDAKTIVRTAYHKHSSPVKESDHSRKLKLVQQTVCESIRRLDPILSTLLVKRAITSQEHETILAHTTVYQRATHLLDVLSAKPVTAYQYFLEALDETLQQHLHRLLEEKDYEMNDHHKETLVDHFTFLKENIVLSGSTLLDNLLETGVLDDQEVEEIRSKQTSFERINCLLHSIMRTSSEQYQLFLESLNRADHQHVYNKLIGASNEEETFSSEAFLNNPTLLHVLDISKCIWDTTVLGEELFVVHGTNDKVSVYNTNNFKLSREIKISYSQFLFAIVACAHNNCLYMSSEYHVHRYDLLLKTVINRWSVDGCYVGLSVTRSHTLLVTLCDANRIQEYTPDGGLIKEIRLDSSIEVLRHCIQLSNDQFVVYSRSRDSRESHRGVVSIIDMNGCIVQGYSTHAGSGVGVLNCMAVDKHGHVIVADCYNNTVELLSPTLTHLGYIQIPGYKLSRPRALHLDELTHRLYIGELDSWRLFVLSDGSIRSNADVVKDEAYACTIS